MWGAIRPLRLRRVSRFQAKKPQMWGAIELFCVIPCAAQHFMPRSARDDGGMCFNVQSHQPGSIRPPGRCSISIDAMRVCRPNTLLGLCFPSFFPVISVLNFNQKHPHPEAPSRHPIGCGWASKDRPQAPRLSPILRDDFPFSEENRKIPQDEDIDCGKRTTARSPPDRECGQTIISASAGSRPANSRAGAGMSGERKAP